ncbi:MAG: hypothetical protein ACP5UM_05190 [Anaerolineae bacterium]
MALFADLEEDEEALAPGPSPVLVVVLTRPKDLRIAREEGWYRIPVRHAPRRLAAEYLAFYLTGAFGEERWTVRYYAPVRRYHLATRAELLPDEADHPRAQDLYYKVEIGPLQELPHPIPSRRLRRITFIMTDLERLFTAREINDLWGGNHRQDLLWQELKHRHLEAERGLEVREGRATYRVDFAIPCARGTVAIQVGAGEGDLAPLDRAWEGILQARGWRCLRFTGRELDEALARCVEEVVEAVRRLGGQRPGPLEQGEGVL